MKTYVLGFLFDEHQESVVLILKKRPDWQSGKVNGIGGKKEEGESPAYAMTREFKEETGVEIKVSQWERCIILESEKENWTVHIFRAYAPKEAVNSCKTMEDEEVFVCKINSLPSNVIFNLQWIIPLLNDGVEFPISIKDTNDYE